MQLQCACSLLVALALLDKLPCFYDQLLLASDEHHLGEDLDVEDVVVIHEVFLVLNLVFQGHAKHVERRCLLHLNRCGCLRSHVVLEHILVHGSFFLDIHVIAFLEEDFVVDILPLDLVLLNSQLLQVEVALCKLLAMLKEDLRRVQVVLVKHLEFLLKADDLVNFRAHIHGLSRSNGLRSGAVAWCTSITWCGTRGSGLSQAILALIHICMQ